MVWWKLGFGCVHKDKRGSYLLVLLACLLSACSELSLYTHWSRSGLFFLNLVVGIFLFVERVGAISLEN